MAYWLGKAHDRAFLMVQLIKTVTQNFQHTVLELQPNINFILYTIEVTCFGSSPKSINGYLEQPGSFTIAHEFFVLLCSIQSQLIDKLNFEFCDNPACLGEPWCSVWGICKAQEPEQSARDWLSWIKIHISGRLSALGS